MMWKWLAFAVLGFIIVLTSCSDDDSQVVAIENFSLDSELEPYFESFIIEASKRQLDVTELVNATGGNIEVIEDQKILAQCISTSAAHTIKIDQDTWDKSNSLKREFLVFHELGHCVLDRDHDDSSDARGRCKSMMQSGTSGCTMNYNSNSREDYLDELFLN